MLAKLKITSFILTLLVHVNVSAAILDRAEAEQADLGLLENEATLFQSIGLGIALSLAQCEGIELCSVNVEENELRELINTLDNRIGSLELRQEEAEDPGGFEKVITAYVNERDNYSAHLEKLRSISGSLDEEIDLFDTLEPEADFPVESAVDAELLEYVEDELSLFEDDELEDDEDLGDLPELPELEDSQTTP